MAETKQNLPFRPLEVRGHGVWDPERKVFYPFKWFSTTAVDLPAKAGIRYFVHVVTISMENHGDTDWANGYWRTLVNGVVLYLLYAMVGKTTDASGVSTCTFASVTLDVLTDAGSLVEYLDVATNGYGTIVYAEIPDDVSGQ